MIVVIRLGTMITAAASGAFFVLYHLLPLVRYLCQVPPVGLP